MCNTHLKSRDVGSTISLLWAANLTRIVQTFNYVFYFVDILSKHTKVYKGFLRLIDLFNSPSVTLKPSYSDCCYYYLELPVYIVRLIKIQEQFTKLQFKVYENVSKID